MKPFPGGLTTVREHSVEAGNRQYLVVRCAHHFAEEYYRATSGALAASRPYQDNFEFSPADRQFRAPMLTPKPLVHGPQTATVVARGPSIDSEEIDTDDNGYGRIKVRFHWDREDKRSCWLRIAQMWAGPRWGGQFIPRIGMEVVVEFLEGDPDRPLVVGAVYNGHNRHPYSLPENNTQSGVKSDSSKGHGGYNESMFEDQKRWENIRTHAQRDHNVEILNSETVKIGQNFGGGASRDTTLVNGDDRLEISNGSQSVTIHVGTQTTVVDQSTTITSNFSSITLQTGASSIKLTPSDIEISSGTISLSAAIINLN